MRRQRRIAQGPAALKPPGKLAEGCAIRTCDGQEDTEAGRTLDHDHVGGDFDQTKAQRRELHNRERRAFAIALRAVSMSQ